MLEHVHWLGHDTFRIDGSSTIYIDPWKLPPGSPRADLVLVTQGFHSTAAAPNCNLYFLNYLAGELLDEARATPPFDDPTFAYIKEDWGAHTLSLPVIDQE